MIPTPPTPSLAIDFAAFDNTAKQKSRAIDNLAIEVAPKMTLKGVIGVLERLQGESGVHGFTRCDYDSELIPSEVKKCITTRELQNLNFALKKTRENP